jgi:aryl-alcohol dehydrogenase-like predicted oxidoreductase
MMEYTYLGRSGLKISRMCLGTMNFGWHTPEAEAFRIMDAALEAGINLIDTANSYGGGKTQRGATEELIGRWFARGESRRERVVLATKVYGSMPDAYDGPNASAGLSAFKVRRHIEASLRRLRTDRIELYQMHHIDEHVTWSELWEVFTALMYQGKIVYVGSSNFAAWHLVQAQEAARARGLFGLVSEQHKYNLMCRLPELEVLPATTSLGVGLLAYSPLEGGLLGCGADNPVTGGRNASDASRRVAERSREQLTAFVQFCKELGEEQATVALAWLLAKPQVTALIIGPRTVDQFQHSLRALEVVLDESALKKLDEIFPGPGGAAPRAYAW